MLAMSRWLKLTTYRLGLAVLCSAALVAAAAPHGGGLPVASFDETTSVSWVLVPVTVEGADEDLKAEDFRLSVDDRPVPFEDFVSPFETPQTLLIFQDLSGSMANAGKLEAGRQIVRWFLERARPEDSMSLTTFASGKILVEVPITDEPEVIHQHVDHWQAYGVTALHDAITWIPEVRLTARAAPAVILITDGLDNASRFTPAEARAMAKTAEVPVFVIALRSSLTEAKSRDGNPRYGDVLRRLAEVTGGRYVEARSGDVESACATIQQALRNRYALGFRLAAGGEERYRSIRVTLPGKRLGLRFRAGYSGAAPHR